MTDEKDELRTHPVQLASLNVTELHIESNVAPDIKTGVEESEVSISTASSDYNEEKNRISVSLRAEVGMGASNESNEFPFSLRVELVGDFHVDETRFPIDEIQHWASHNAPMVLFPYIREHVFSLTSRCGFRPMLLPMLEVPTFEPGESD